MPVGGSKSGGGGGSAKSGDIRAGGAFWELYTKDGISGTLDKLSKRAKAFGSLLMKGGAGLAAGGAAILAPIAGVFKEAIDRGTEIKLLADRFGTTTEKLSELGYAFETAGVDLNGFSDTVKDLSGKISQAADGQDEAFRRVGLSAKALVGLPLDEQFAAVADAISAVNNPTDQTRVAMDLLGESGLKLLPVLKRGSAGLRELGEEGRDAGRVMSGETAAQAESLSKTFHQTWSTIKAAILSVGEALLPQADEIKAFAASVRDVAKAVRVWIQDNKGVVLTVAGVGAALIAAGAALAAVGAGVSLAGTALVGLKAIVLGTIAVLGVLKASILAILSPVGLAIAVGAALGAGLIYLVAQTEQGAAGFKMIGNAAKTVGQEMKAGFADALGITMRAWGGIQDAIKGGRIDLAAEVGFKGLQLGWAKVLLYFQKKWNEFKGFFVDAWYDLWMLAEIGFVVFVGKIEKIWDTVTTRIAQAFILAIKYAIDSQLAPIARMLELVGADENAADVRNVTSGLGDAFNNLGAGLAGKLAGVDKRVGDETSRIVSDAQKAEAERLKARAEKLAGAQAAVDQAEGEFAQAIADAAQAARQTGKSWWRDAADFLAGRAAERLPTPTQLSSSIKGGFYGDRAAGQFAYGDKSIGERQLTTQKQIAKNTAPLPEIKNGLAGLAGALTFQ